ncbi:acetate--CoA ligase [Nitrosospira lacus]|uniref:acetate--CoA ligase n=1 Tax=Nitrosospira lacus TaxID=1288494 RepID=A0A1W6SSS7_9PROT|nr:acetate--CoA ligase [Nitrosospira lacus]ARO88868.1 acetate--CoA ligase [Nitrosospira lacus]
MTANIITKPLTSFRVAPNMSDYARTYREFTWEAAAQTLAGLADGHSINIAHEAVTRHAKGSQGQHLALRWLGRNGARQDFSYQELEEQTNRFANVLAGIGVQPGERVFVLAGRIPELYIAVLGTLKQRCVASPLFSAFGPEPIQTRLTLGAGSVLVTTASLYQKKIAGLRERLPQLKHVLLVHDSEIPDSIPGTLDLAGLLRDASTAFVIGPTSPGDPALLHFTSGTTGKPKGAVHVHGAVVAHDMTGRLALDFHAEDIFWCTADPGWVTGTSYGIISPLTNGITSIVDEGDFDAERWYSILAEQKISVWYTAPTAVRMMMKGGAESVRQHEFPQLRFIASVGEPLNPQAVQWGLDAFGLPIHDNWWQTETGGIMIANYAAMNIKPGSMGKPLPGIKAAIVKRCGGEAIEIITAPDVQGELALKRGWPSMFRGYLNDDERYRKCFADGWYLTGDLAKCDQDGYYWFVGRADDVIKSSGHLIGPFEVESALMEHPAVAEAGVIGKPDPMQLETVKAFIALKPCYVASEALRRELLGFARKRLGAAVAPKEIDFVESLPKTRSGKIMRRLLKARELGLPEGDISTLESGA